MLEENSNSESVPDSRGGRPWKRLLATWPYAGPVVGLIGVTLALYFHFEAIQERLPTYYVAPQRAKVVDVSGPSPSELRVLHRGQPVIGKNVVAATIYFWNDGKEPIRQNDVLDDLIFELPEGSQILEARLLRASRAVIGFQAGPVPENALNRLPISFKILEKSDGGVIQVIYAGAVDAPIRLKGTIVGAGQPRVLRAERAEQFFSRRRSPRESLKGQVRLAWTVIGVGAFAFLASVGMAFWVRRQAARDRLYPRHTWRWLVLAFVTILTYGLFGAYLLYDTSRTLSPGVPSSIWLEQ